MAVNFMDRNLLQRFTLKS